MPYFWDKTVLPLGSPVLLGVHGPLINKSFFNFPGVRSRDGAQELYQAGPEGGAGVYVIQHFFLSSLTKRQNKLERFVNDKTFSFA